MAVLSLSSFNVHAGVDGLGRPFDALAACLELDADVLVLQEAWAPDDGLGLVDELCRRGYEAHRGIEVRGWIYPPAAETEPGWGPLLRRRPGVGMRVQWPGHPALLGNASLGTRTGTVGLAVLSRVPVLRHSEIDLGRLPGDVARSAVVLEVGPPDGPLRVVGVHMSHLRNGSPVQFVRLRRALGDARRTAVLGDMNLWGPPLELLLPGWRRAVRGRSWPSWRPTFQIDHVLTSPDLEIAGRQVGEHRGSDHRPVRVEVNVGAR